MGYYDDDTIAAISTHIGAGGIGIVRVSGNGCMAILDKIFISQNKNFEAKTHTIYYGHIADEKGIVIDEVLVSIMLAPKSYTKEDVIEINCHGGVKCVQAVLEQVLIAGARMAEPGEFTKRAFLNGRIDLSQAEAVIDIINAKTNLALKAAESHLGGRLTKVITEMRAELLLAIANIEASIDYPEHDLEEMNLKTIEAKTKEILKKINKLLESAEFGKIVRDGIETVIIGKPNVGKSSLLNYILDEERAIVTDIPGTTRDSLSEYVNINDIVLKLIDTAGIRETEDKIEKIGVEKSRKIAENADLVLLMLDATESISSEDIDLIHSVANKKYLILINKTDLKMDLDLEHLYNSCDKDKVLFISVKENRGFTEFYDTLKEMFYAGEISSNDAVLISNLRHKNALVNAKNSLESVLGTIEDGLFEDFVSIDLQGCYHFLGEIIGESMDDDVINKIFSEFCLGK